MAIHKKRIEFAKILMLSAQPSLPLWIEIAAMATTGAYGAAVARSRNVPVSGTLFAGIMMGLGGGMARDVLLGEQAVACPRQHVLRKVGGDDPHLPRVEQPTKVLVE